MARLATRKTSSRSGRTSSRSTRSAKSRTTTAKRRAPAKKTTQRKSASQAKTTKTAKRRASTANKAAGNTKIAPKVRSLMQNMKSLIDKRKKANGAQDSVAKRLGSIHSDLQKELKKTNIINPKLAQTLKKVNPSVRGIANVPKTIRQAPQQLSSFMRKEVRGNVEQFLKNTKRQLGPLQTELKKLDTQLNRQIKQAKGGKSQLKMDPSVKRRFNTLNNNMSKLKTQLNKHLSKIATHGNKQVESSVKSLKKQLDDAQKLLKRDIGIINRNAKATKSKAGQKQQPLAKAGQAKALETKFNSIKREIDKAQTRLQQFIDQLKAVKQL